MADEESKDTGKPGYIKLRIVGLSDEVRYNVRPSTQLVKLRKRYADKFGFPMTKLGFLFEGRIVKDLDTPEKLGMINLDVIEAFEEQQF